MRPAAACIIVAFHRPDPLASLVSRLQDRRIEVVVVNVEDDPAVSAAVSGTGVVQVPIVDNVGYGAAVNAGTAVAHADVVVFANDDVDLGPGEILALADAVVREGGVVVPRIVDPGGITEPSIAALATPLTLLRDWMLAPDLPPRWLRARFGIEKWRQPTGAERIDAAMAAVVACRRDLLLDVPLPEAYFLYWEESEWFWWLRQRGVAVWYDPAVVVVHQGGRADLRPEKSRLLARNALRCVRRTQGRGRAVLAWPLIIGWNLRLLAVAAVRAAARPSEGNRSAVRARLAGLAAALCAWPELR